PGAGRGPIGEGCALKAVVMAGGEGTRLRPLTSNQPKPMMPMANRPLMEHVVRRLAVHGFDDIVVTVAFLASHIRNYFGDGSELGVDMRYATEETPLGTAGSVRNAAAELDDTFMVISGDVLSDIDLGAVVKAHRSSGALATQGLVVDGYWEDVGTVDAYHRAHRDVLDQRVSVDIPGFRLGDGIWLGEGADVDPAAEITGPVIIGDNCRIEAGARIGEYT